MNQPCKSQVGVLAGLDVDDAGISRGGGGSTASRQLLVPTTRRTLVWNDDPSV